MILPAIGETEHRGLAGRRSHCHNCSSGVPVASPHMNPVSSPRQVNLSGRCAGLQHRRDQQVGTEHVDALRGEAVRIFRECKRPRAHRRHPRGRIVTHQVADIGPESFTQVEKTGQDRLSLGAVGPELVVAAGVREDVEQFASILDFAIGSGIRNVVRYANTMEAADRREHPELEPAHPGVEGCRTLGNDLRRGLSLLPPDPQVTGHGFKVLQGVWQVFDAKSLA